MLSIDIKESEPDTPYIRDMASGAWLLRLPDMRSAEMVISMLRAEREACAAFVHDRLGADGHGVAKMIREGRHYR